tara:strand:- start:2924 stop:3106 length:183 start_codon:yes stop_codon:yes gene_type:complete
MTIETIEETTIEETTIEETTIEETTTTNMANIESRIDINVRLPQSTREILKNVSIVNTII